MFTQCIRLILGIPFLFLTGWTLAVPMLIFAMIGFQFSKAFTTRHLGIAL
jgi:hypothetical protein